MNTYTDIMCQREAIRRIVALHKAGNPRLFGAVVKGQHSSAGQVDLLVDALPGATMLDIVRMEQQLQRELGLPFEVSTPSGLSRQWRDEVLAQAVAL